MSPRSAQCEIRTLTQKQTANTGQLSKSLYHIPISWPCFEWERAGPSDGDITIEKNDKRSKERRFIILLI